MLEIGNRMRLGMCRRLNIFFEFFLDYSSYVFLRKNAKVKGRPIVRFNLSDPESYGRHLLVLMRHLDICGYEVSLFSSLEIYRKMSKGDPYSAQILKEDYVSFQKKDPVAVLRLHDDNLDPDYFINLLGPIRKNTYHIPISMHPNMYRIVDWDWKPSIDQERKNSIFMAGNLDSTAYKKIDVNLFNVLNRLVIHELVSKQENYIEFKRLEQLQVYLSGPEKGHVIMNDRRRFDIPMIGLRKTLSVFKYFIACPGVVKPHSHNLAEALSVGTIPIIQKTYADMLIPALKNGVNCFTFENESDFEYILQKSLEISEKDWIRMSLRVLDYYEINLSPKQVVESLFNNSHDHFLIQAKHSSNLFSESKSRM